MIYSEFKRKFSISMYKNLKFNIAEMTFFKDFVNDTRGDLYPVMEKSQDCIEVIKDNSYIVKQGNVKRMFCQFFPYATYELSAKIEDGDAGICFCLPAKTQAVIMVKSDKLLYFCESVKRETDIHDFVKNGEFTMIISCRPNAFDVYFKNNGSIKFAETFYEEKFADSNNYSVFSNSIVSLAASGNVAVKNMVSYIDNGISIADIRPIKYENGEVLYEQGKVYLSASMRMQEGTFQGMFSWIPGTSEFSLTGAVFYDCGDNHWRNYLAPSVLYHREKKQWYIWVSSFEHEHILAYSAFDGDPRFGINVIDVQLMKQASDCSKITDFVGFVKDEDPDFLYDEKSGKWLMAICRINPETQEYSYMFFESEHPFSGYTYIGKGPDGSETGGSFVKIKEELFFVCGNDFNKTSEYRIYSKDGMKNARFNYSDGGFRGWGTVMVLKMGSRKRCFWLTFDRHNGSLYNWSYGNLYCFEAD